MPGRSHPSDRPPAPGQATRLALAGLLWVLLAIAPVAWAHAGGGSLGAQARFVLPTWVLWAAGGAVVAISFAVLAVYASDQRIEPGRPVTSPTEAPRAGQGSTLGSLVSVALLALAIAGGLIGKSLLPFALLWLLAWVALPLVAYLLADPWPRLTPFQALAPLASRLRGHRGPRAYPEHLGTWPATALLLLLIGLEVAGGLFGQPRLLALGLLAYTLVTLLGMARYGAGPWLSHAEVLGVMLAWWGAASPVSRETTGWRLQRPGARLGHLAPKDPSEVAFVIALLYGVNLDSFLATSLGQASLATVSSLGTPVALALVTLTGYGLFLAAFWASAWAIGQIAPSLQGLDEVAGRFAGTLVPIAVGYHLAHTLPYLVETWPTLVQAASDPLGLGWHLVPVPASTGLPGAWLGWLAGFQVTAILAGHVLAVVAAHEAAYGAFPSRVQAIRGELPLTGVMVAYTLVGLWILSLAGGGGL